MKTDQILLSAVLGFLASWIVYPFLVRHSVAGDRRDFHQTHGVSVSRLGGLGLVAAFLVVTVISWLFGAWNEEERHEHVLLVLGSLAMFGVGFWDDLRPLGARIKLALQLLIAGNVALWGLQVTQISHPLGQGVIQLGWLGPVLTVIWLVAMTNLINLIDGIDGLAGGICLMLMCLLAYVGLGGQLSFPTLVAIGMAAALVAFLFHNFPPAKIYMGDGGAYFLGFLIGMLALVNSNKGSVLAALIAPLFALALPIADVTFSIVRRGVKGLPIFRPDRRHIHHRLVNLGLSRKRVVLSMYLVSLVFLLMAFAVFWSRGQLIPILFGCCFLFLALSARRSGIFNEWLSSKNVLRELLQLRKETRYAIALCSWLEVEAERCHSLERLWSDFQFLSERLGFSRVRLELTGGERRAEWGEASEEECHIDRQDLNFGQFRGIEFWAPKAQMGEKIFCQLTELAAECWQKSIRKWEMANEKPARMALESRPQSKLKSKL